MGNKPARSGESGGSRGADKVGPKGGGSAAEVRVGTLNTLQELCRS